MTVQAIQTRYAGPTNSTGSRIIATAAAGRVVHPYDHALNLDENHKAAAAKLAAKFGWTGETVAGVIKSGAFVHVFLA